MSDPPRSGSNDDAGTSTQCGILTWEKEEDLDVAVIESTLIVEEIDQQRRRLVRKALSVSSQAVYFRGNIVSESICPETHPLKLSGFQHYH
jgi:hypothetical protein